MSEKLYYHEDNQATVLRSWVLAQMLRGAGYAAVVVILFGVVLGGLRLISAALPEESKQAPSPYSFYEQPVNGMRDLA